MSSQNYILIAVADAFSVFNPISVLYLVPLMTILLVLGWILYRRRMHIQPTSSSAPTLLELHPQPQLLPSPPRPFAKNIRKSPPPLPTTHSSRPQSTDTTPESETSTQAAFSIHSATPHHSSRPDTNHQHKTQHCCTQCTTCDRHYEIGTRYCYIDGMPLTHANTTDALITQPANGPGPRRKLCRKCGTRYSAACSFCSQDGTPLTDIHGSLPLS